MHVRTCTIHPGEHLLGQVEETSTEGLATSASLGGQGEPGIHRLPEVMEEQLLICITTLKYDSDAL